jgi:hypothetical protein
MPCAPALQFRRYVRYHVFWKNTGATPALKAHLEPGYLYKERTYLIASDFSDSNTIHPMGWEPWKASHTAIEPNGTGVSPIISVPAPHPGKTLFFAGYLIYTDIFLRPHMTQFCNRLEGNTLAACNIHNDMN